MRKRETQFRRLARANLIVDSEEIKTVTSPAIIDVQILGGYLNIIGILIVIMIIVAVALLLRKIKQMLSARYLMGKYIRRNN